MSNAPHSTPTAVYQAVPAGPAPSSPGAPGAPTPPSAPRRTALVIGLAVVALFALLTGGFLVLHSGSSAPSMSAAAATSQSSGKAPGTTAAVADATSTTAATDPAGNPGSNSGSNSGSDSAVTTGRSSGGSSTGDSVPAPAPKPAAPAPTTAPKPAAPAPVITSFTTPENIDCHNNDNPMFSASWTTTNAVKTTIAIDGPGIYKAYGPNGSDSLPFNCSSPHTFKLTAFGQDGKTVTKTITLQPRNVRPPATPDTDQ